MKRPRPRQVSRRSIRPRAEPAPRPRARAMAGHRPRVGRSATGGLRQAVPQRVRRRHTRQRTMLAASAGPRPPARWHRLPAVRRRARRPLYAVARPVPDYGAPAPAFLAPRHALPPDSPSSEVPGYRAGRVAGTVDEPHHRAKRARHRRAREVHTAHVGLEVGADPWRATDQPEL